MKADVAISDFVVKCDEESVQLPENPWQALREVIAALRRTRHHTMGYLQVAKALEQLKSNVTGREGAEGAVPVAVRPSARRVRRQQRTFGHEVFENEQDMSITDSAIAVAGGDVRALGQSMDSDAMGPVASRKKRQKEAKKSRTQEDVEAAPALRVENQALVDQLVQLGEFEMHHGHAQRGISRMRAAKSIRDSEMVVTSGAQAKQLDSVGAALATKINQLLDVGLEAALGEYEGDGEAWQVLK
ncbi:unnamed protein product [Hyaloperonospora brassicae]|uniref:Crossover junction endonuclease MUS81-like HHH domain-containing protein n=1 Tax=Hyaloperonospora brassicae TaxID=162125 RepID=A0AAV0TVR8_HYABA|nr:unnamed protein product [Hyaloperonospora brassicae]